MDIDALRDIIIETHKIGLNINYNNALYVKYLANSETIPKELVSYWKKNAILGFAFLYIKKQIRNTT